MKRPEISTQLYNRICELGDRIDPERRKGFPEACRVIRDYVDERLSKEFTEDIREQLEAEVEDRQPFDEPGKIVSGPGVGRQTDRF